MVTLKAFAIGVSLIFPPWPVAVEPRVEFAHQMNINLGKIRIDRLDVQYKMNERPKRFG